MVICCNFQCADKQKNRDQDDECNLHNQYILKNTSSRKNHKIDFSDRAKLVGIDRRIFLLFLSRFGKIDNLILIFFRCVCLRHHAPSGIYHKRNDIILLCFGADGPENQIQIDDAADNFFVFRVPSDNIVVVAKRNHGPLCADRILGCHNLQIGHQHLIQRCHSLTLGKHSSAVRNQNIGFLAVDKEGLYLMVTDLQHAVSLPQRLLHFIILSICRCYLIRDFFDVAVRIQQIDQFTVDLRHITVDLIDIELCRIGNIFICQLAVFPNAPEQADNKPHQDQKNRSSKPQGRILQTAYSNAAQHPSFSFLPEIHKRIHPSFFSVCRATAGRRTLPRSSGSRFTLTEYICNYVLCNTAHYITFLGFVHAESVLYMVRT